MQVLFNSKAYSVQLDRSELQFDLVRVVSPAGLVSELLHPLDCLRLGVHNGGYFNSLQSNAVHGLDATAPHHEVLSWYFRDKELSMLPDFYHAPLTQAGDPAQNYFGISASSSLEQWQANGWLQGSAPEGWFEAYAQYCVFGIAKVDEAGTAWLPGTNGLTNWSVEQKRLLSFVARHSAQVANSCRGDLSKRRKQRQALLNWSSPLAFV